MERTPKWVAYEEASRATVMTRRDCLGHVQHREAAREVDGAGADHYLHDLMTPLFGLVALRYAGGSTTLLRTTPPRSTVKIALVY